MSSPVSSSAKRVTFADSIDDSKEKIMSHYPNGSLSIFSNPEDILKLKEVEFENKIFDYSNNLEYFVDPITRGIDSTGTHFIAVKYEQTYPNGEKNTTVEILTKSKGDRISHIFFRATPYMAGQSYNTIEKESLDRLKRLLNNENVGALYVVAVNPLLFKIAEENTRTISDGSSATSFIKV